MPQEMHRETLLFSDRVMTPAGLRPATLHLKEGLIYAVYAGRKEIRSLPVEDMEGRVIMPGLIDPHVHINEPGRTEWEGFDHATRSAAAGGITTVVDMPLNSTPVTTSVASFERKLEATTNQLHINCGFWGGIVPGNANEIRPLLERGVLGLKAFLTYSGIEDFPAATEIDLRKAMPLLSAYQLPLLVHCELSNSQEETFKALKQNPRSYPAYLASRPEVWELNAIDLLIRLCWDYQCRSHIVHLSASPALEAIRIARQAGLPLTVETCPQYLCCAAEDIPDGATLYKCAPPIRKRANNEKLWTALQNGLIDFIASDHSPAPPSLKCLEEGDFSKAWGGIAGLQLTLPLIWTAAQKKNISLEQIYKWLSFNPAQFLGLGHRKGVIQSGYDADLVIWNPEADFIVLAENLYHRHQQSPYLNQRLSGQVERTYVKGKLVFNNGEWDNLQQGELILRDND